MVPAWRSPCSRRVCSVSSLRDTIVIGGSAGSIEALCALIAGLPRDLPASVLVVIHKSEGPNLLAEILAAKGRLPVTSPERDEPLVRSHVYVARPGLHLQLHDSAVRSVSGPRVNAVRPAIDVLFRSAARARGSRVVAVVLSGLLDDGVTGLLEVRASGGVAVVQSPSDAIYPDLPGNAIAGAGADHVVPVSDMAAVLVRLVSEPGPGGRGGPPGEGDPGAKGGRR